MHGTERDAQRRRDYVNSEIIAMNERIRAIEDRINAVNRRLDELGQPDLVDERFGIWPRQA